jgi:nucleoside-diphosphate-sugar epimerase
VDAIVHLAAVVGAPACKKHPKEAEEINVGVTRLLERHSSREQGMIFASTGSNHGAVVGQLCTGDTPLEPLTIYGKTKAEAERRRLDSGNAVCFRFATAFGVSPRMRLDLLINDFCCQAKVNQNLIAYEKGYKRSFLHVADVARSFLSALGKYERMRGRAFNVGDESMNFSKEDIALKVRGKVDCYLHFAEIGKDGDQRNYEVSYERIRALGFRTAITVDEGIDELLRARDALEVRNGFGNV